MNEEKLLTVTREFVERMITMSQRLQALAQVVRSTAKDELKEKELIRAFGLVADIVDNEGKTIEELSTVFYETMLRREDEKITS